MDCPVCKKEIDFGKAKKYKGLHPYRKVVKVCPHCSTLVMKVKDEDGHRLMPAPFTTGKLLK